MNTLKENLKFWTFLNMSDNCDVHERSLSRPLLGLFLLENLQISYQFKGSFQTSLYSLNYQYLRIFTQLVFKVNFGKNRIYVQFFGHAIFMTIQRSESYDYLRQANPEQFKLDELINSDKESNRANNNSDKTVSNPDI